MNIAELKNVNKAYFEGLKDHQVLFDLSFTIEENSFISIVGQSGSGKSTLLNILGTLDTPTSGEVHIHGKRTDELSKAELAHIRNQEIGFIFQYHYLLPEFSTKENVLMPYQLSGNKVNSSINDRVDDILHKVGLSEVSDRKASKLSGGQAQRAAIARALINNPSIVLADEPTGNLDSAAREKVYNLLRDIHKEFNTAFVIITHDTSIANRTDRMIELQDGRILKDTIL